MAAPGAQPAQPRAVYTPKEMMLYKPTDLAFPFLLSPDGRPDGAPLGPLARGGGPGAGAGRGPARPGHPSAPQLVPQQPPNTAARIGNPRDKAMWSLSHMLAMQVTGDPSAL